MMLIIVLQAVRIFFFSNLCLAAVLDPDWLVHVCYKQLSYRCSEQIHQQAFIIYFPSTLIMALGEWAFKITRIAKKWHCCEDGKWTHLGSVSQSNQKVGTSLSRWT